MLNFGSGEESHILYKNISQVNFLGWNFWVYKSNEMKVSIEISKRLIFVKCYIKILTQGKLLDYTNISLNVTLISHIYMFLSWVGTVHFPHNWLFHLPSAIHNQRFLLLSSYSSFGADMKLYSPLAIISIYCFSLVLIILLVLYCYSIILNDLLTLGSLFITLKAKAPSLVNGFSSPLQHVYASNRNSWDHRHMIVEDYLIISLY